MLSTRDSKASLGMARNWLRSTSTIPDPALVPIYRFARYSMAKYHESVDVERGFARGREKMTFRAAPVGAVCGCGLSEGRTENLNLVEMEEARTAQIDPGETCEDVVGKGDLQRFTPRPPEIPVRFMLDP